MSTTAVKIDHIRKLNEKNTPINKIINKFNTLLDDYEVLSKVLSNNTNPVNINPGKKQYNAIKNIKNKANELNYLSGILLELELESSEKTNNMFETEKTKLQRQLKKYESHKNKKSAHHKFKIDIYDRNIEDNIFIIYYLLSYGILGLFIYKLLKQ